MRNRNGFTLIELLATIVILAIVVGLTVYGIRYSIDNAKKKTEEVFIGTLRDAINIYLDDSANLGGLVWDAQTATITKSDGEKVEFYRSRSMVTFETIINSEYTPIVESDLRNPATEKLCNINTRIMIYKDGDEVYYYYIDKDDMIQKGVGDEPDTSCLLSHDDDEDYIGYISNLSEDAVEMVNNW